MKFRVFLNFTQINLEIFRSVFSQNFELYAQRSNSDGKLKIKSKKGGWENDNGSKDCVAIDGAKSVARKVLIEHLTMH